MRVKPLRVLVPIAAFAAGIGVGIVGWSDDDADAPFEELRLEDLVDLDEHNTADLPECEDWLTRSVPASEWGEGCQQDDESFLAGSFDCNDGPSLWWSDVLWGYPDERATRFADGKDVDSDDAYRDALEDCLGPLVNR